MAEVDATQSDANVNGATGSADEADSGISTAGSSGEVDTSGPAAEAQEPQGRAGALLKLGAFVLVIIGGYLIAKATPAGDYLTREGIGQGIDWLRGNPWAPVIFVGIYATATALAVPGTILTLAGGAVFGFFWGTLYNFIAANIGANAAFIIARSLGGDAVRRLIGKDSKVLNKLDGIVQRHGFRGLLTLRLIPLVPFNALNFGSGLMRLKWRDYAIATLVGILPGTAIYTFFADALLQGSQEASRDALVRLILAGALLVLLSFLPTILKKMNVRLPGMSTIVVFLSTAVVPLGGLGLAGGVRAASAQQLPDHTEFTEVLAAVVVGAQVDYAKLTADDAGLRAYLGRLEATDISAVTNASQDEQFAFWINAYNACMLKRVIEHYPIKKAGGLHGLKNRAAGRPENSVWQIKDVFTGDHCDVAGEERSQDEIEHEIIRPMGDARIHLAVNCAAWSCPPLIDRAYLAETLQEQLDERVRAFMMDTAHFDVTTEGDKRTVRVNKVLDWFKEDFGGNKEGIRAFFVEFAAGPYREALLDSETKLEFFDYDWTLNDISR